MDTRNTGYRARATLVPLVLRLAAGAALLALVASRVEPASLTVRWDARAAVGVAMAVALVAAAQLLSAVRWRLVLGTEAAPPFAYLVRLYWVGLFFSLFLPTSVGGDAVRAVAVSRASPRPGWAVSSVVLERVLGLAAMFALLAAGALASPAVFRAAAGGARLSVRPGAGVLAACAAAGLALGIVAWRWGRRSALGRRVLRGAGEWWRGMASRPGELAAALGVSVLVQGAYVAAWVQLAAALRLPVPAAEFLVFVPFVSIAAMLPLTVSGIGLREGAWVLLLAGHGVAAADAVAYSLLYFAAYLAVGAAGGVVFALRGMAPAAPRTASSTVFTSTAESLSQ